MTPVSSAAMGPSRTWLAVDGLAVGLLTVVLVCMSGDFTAQWSVFWTIAAAYFVVDAFDVQMPRGDHYTMSSAIVGNAVLVLAPWSAVLSVLVPAIVVFAIGRGETRMGLQRLMRSSALVLAGASAAFLSRDVGADVQTLRAAAVLGGVVLLDFLVSQHHSAVRLRVSLRSTVSAGLKLQGTMLVAQTSAALVGYLVVPHMGLWALAMLTVMLLVMRQALALLLSVRRAYQATIGALARTVEVQDPERRGHSERVADGCAGVGRRLRMRSRDIERMVYAALLHDLGRISIESPGMCSADRLSAAAGMLGGVGFLDDVVPILVAPSAPDAATQVDIDAAYIILRISADDDRMAGGDTVSNENAARRLANWASGTAKAAVDAALSSREPEANCPLASELSQ